jgi:PAS domain S-box-containing protein
VPQDAAYEFSAIQLMRQAAIVTNEKGRICNLNPAAEALFGYEKSELLEQGLYRLFLPDKPKEFGQKISQHINKHRCWIGKSSFFRKDGTSGRVAVELVPFTEHGAKGFLGLMRDISEEALPTAEAPQPATDKAEDAATVSLHRARNDLQVLSSLLSLQANEAGLNDSIKGALLESKDRVACVASVYRLVEGDGDVDFSKLAQEIAHQVLRTHSVNDGRVKIKAPVQPTLLSQKLSITLGLLLHELLVGIVAHTFSNSASGEINIYLKMESNQGVLTIKDNGPFHNATALAQRSGIAWKVVEALTSQLQGELKTLSDLDNELRLNFHVDDKTFGA